MIKDERSHSSVVAAAAAEVEAGILAVDRNLAQGTRSLAVDRGSHQYSAEAAEGVCYTLPAAPARATGSLRSAVHSRALGTHGVRQAVAGLAVVEDVAGIQVGVQQGMEVALVLVLARPIGATQEACPKSLCAA